MTLMYYETRGDWNPYGEEVERTEREYEDAFPADEDFGLPPVDDEAGKRLREFQCNLMFGHTHAIESASMTARGDNKTHMAQSIGCLQVYDPAWLKGKPTKWQQAFAEVAVFPDGFFNYWVTQVFKHRFVAGCGKVYQG